MKTRLIKQKEVHRQQRLKELTPVEEIPAKKPAEVVQEWINKQPKSQQSARKAFAELFAKPQMGNAT